MIENSFRKAQKKPAGFQTQARSVYEFDPETLKSNRFKFAPNDEGQRGVWHKGYMCLFLSNQDGHDLLKNYPYLSGNANDHYYCLGSIKDKVFQIVPLDGDKVTFPEGSVPAIGVRDIKTDKMLKAYPAHALPQKGSFPVETLWEKDEKTGLYDYKRHVGNQIVAVFQERSELDSALKVLEQKINQHRAAPASKAVPLQSSFIQATASQSVASAASQNHPDVQRAIDILDKLTSKYLPTHRWMAYGNPTDPAGANIRLVGKDGSYQGTEIPARHQQAMEKAFLKCGLTYGPDITGEHEPKTMMSFKSDSVVQGGSARPRFDNIDLGFLEKNQDELAQHMASDKGLVALLLAQKEPMPHPDPSAPHKGIQRSLSRGL